MSSSQHRNNSEFVKFIAYLQVIGIILVVFGHSFHEYPYGAPGELLAYKMMYTFRMPLFIFVSGFLLTYTATRKNKNYVIFFHDKAKRLLLPFIILTSITFIPRSLLSFAADDAITINLSSFVKSFLYDSSMPIPFFWFLHASFILLCFSYLFICFSKRLRLNNIIYCSVLLVIFGLLSFTGIPSTLFSLHKVAELGLYFALGITYAEFYKKLDKYIPFENIFFFVSAIAVWLLSYHYSDLHPLVYKLCSFAGIVMCISLSRILVKHNIRIADHLIGATYMIFLLSWFLNTACQQVLHHFTDFPWWIYTLLSLFAGIYLPLLFYRFLMAYQDKKAVRITTFLLGQPTKDKITEETVKPAPIQIGQSDK